MKIGLLICGDVSNTLKNIYGTYSNCLAREFGLINDNELSIWNAHKYELPSSVNQCDVYIISGSPSSVYDEESWIDSLILFTQKAFRNGKKLIGICFGHQLINYALGGSVTRSINGWGLGVYSTTVYQNFLELRQGEKLSLFAMHQDQVIRPAKAFEIIAGNHFCPNYMTRFQNQVLTMQGHPEFNAQFFLALLQETRQKYNEHTMSNAIATSKISVDNMMFNKLVSQFITNISDTKYEEIIEVCG
ncbi:type 1 glutamine amidotransferase [Shewanella saliphila]|uniref:GMP synthase n=1 Tax=Shewanella saliphila TaxID=2282698 RepID=A0ABQ2QAB7_9GAMM|nr:type 1 glutamine amidotransferase [Shewanella saliphila]MCL1102511.1 type 1 glutamine amidotransferase [Shewanella saliphila]GGP68531.1 GMP synthase [Shewanella saliphila]